MSLESLSKLDMQREQASVFKCSADYIYMHIDLFEAAGANIAEHSTMSYDGIKRKDAGTNHAEKGTTGCPETERREVEGGAPSFNFTEIGAKI